MPKPTKEGETVTCKCGTNLTARMKDYGGGYAPKLQWQNPDGSAHYNYDAGTKKFSCMLPGAVAEEKDAGTTPAAPPATAKEFYDDELDGATIQALIKNTNHLQQAEAIVENTLKLGAEKAGKPYEKCLPKVGMYLKLLIQLGILK